MKKVTLMSIIAGLIMGFFCPSSMNLSAQASEPAILSIFEKYADMNGVTVMEASKELLDTYDIERIKTIIFKDGRMYIEEIRELLNIDKQNAYKMKETLVDGVITSGYYRLKSIKADHNRYIIVKMAKNYKTTLIYIEGKLTPQELVEMLK